MKAVGMVQVNAGPTACGISGAVDFGALRGLGAVVVVDCLGSDAVVVDVVEVLVVEVVVEEGVVEEVEVVATARGSCREGFTVPGCLGEDA
jgi:hypothetical protein